MQGSRAEMIILYIVVEAILGIASLLCWLNDYNVAAIILLVLFVIGLIPIIGDDIVDVLSDIF